MQYYLKVWLFTILVSPLLLIAILWVYNSGKSSDIIAAAPFWLFAVFFGSLFSLPSLFLFWFVYDDIRDRAIADWKKKIVLGLVGIILICASFFVIDRRAFLNSKFNILIWPLVYSICLVIGAFIYTVKTKQTH